MSMISEQVKELRELADLYYGEIRNYSNTIRQAADTIEALSEKLENMERSERYYNGGWILCKDRLPEIPKENPVFDYKPLELYLVSVNGADYAFRVFWNGKFFTDRFSRVENVIAWQPLPQPYKPNKER